MLFDVSQNISFNVAKHLYNGKPKIIGDYYACFWAMGYDCLADRTLQNQASI